MNQSENSQITVNAGQRKHVGFGVKAIVKPQGTVLVTAGGNAHLAKDAVAFVLSGGTVEAQRGAVVYLKLKLNMFVQVPPNEILVGLDPRAYRAIYDYTPAKN